MARITHNVTHEVLAEESSRCGSLCCYAYPEDGPRAVAFDIGTHHVELDYVEACYMVPSLTAAVLRMSVKRPTGAEHGAL